MRTTILFWILFLVVLLSFAGVISCGCGNGDSSSDSEQIDDDDSCYTCGITADCTAAFGLGWACYGGCCVEVGDDDVNDDVDDDMDDDVNDDVNDDTADCEGCLIDEICYADGEANPDNICGICHVSLSIDSWTDNDGVSCDDGLFCNGDDACVGGACVSSGDPCDAQCESCNEGAETCDAVAAACDDGVFCNGDDACDAGVCSVHSGDPCDAQCESCNEGADICDAVAAACDDGVFCNGDDTCEAGICTVHAGDPCPDNGDFCDGTESCNEGTDSCDSSGDPCVPVNELCMEENDFCQPTCAGVQIDNGPLDVDNDGDGYSEDIGDCNDDSNAVNPFATEVFDGVDNNCDGTIDEGFDEDCDGYQKEWAGGDDCEDDDWRINPDATDDGLLIDSNCDGLVGDAASGDADSDGFAALGTSGGIVDCDDNDADVFPGALELPGDDIDQNCSGIDLLPDNGTGIFVAPSGSNTNPGTMAAPKRTIYAGVILASLTGKSVFAAAGDYTEDVEADVSLFGGYESAGWTRDIGANVTTVSAATSTAVRISGSNPVAIQGFTINGGTESCSYGVYNNKGAAILMNNNIYAGSGYYCGYGVYNYKGTITLVSNVIDGGSGSDDNSYGVYNYRGTATLANNTINGGTGSWNGYGVYSNYGTATLVNNTIDGRSGGGYRSYGVYIDYGTMTLANNDINGGSATGYYGRSYGVYNDYGTATLVNNLINGGSGSSSYGVRNSSGPAMLVNNNINGGSGNSSHGVYSSDTTTLVNNTINGGSGSSYSYGMYTRFGLVTLVNNDIWGADMDCMVVYRAYPPNDECEANTIAEVNACAWSRCADASGNISDDPLFVNPGEGDFHLLSGSPCIDAGIDPVPDYIDQSFLYLVEFDFEGDARPYGAGWDIGVDEWTP